MDKNKCGISCAHQKDVHDCEKCSPHVAYVCAPKCEKCAALGKSCTCPIEDNNKMTRDDIADTIYGLLAEDKSNLLAVADAIIRIVTAFDALTTENNEYAAAIREHCLECRNKKEKCSDYDTCNFFAFCKSWVVAGAKNGLWIAVPNNPLHKYEGVTREWFCYERYNEDTTPEIIEADDSAQAARVYANVLYKKGGDEREWFIAVSPKMGKGFAPPVSLYRITRDEHGAYHVNFESGM